MGGAGLLVATLAKPYTSISTNGTVNPAPILHANTTQLNLRCVSAIYATDMILFGSS